MNIQIFFWLLCLNKLYINNFKIWLFFMLNFFFLKKSLFIEKRLKLIFCLFLDRISMKYEILKSKYHKYENFIIYIFSRILFLKLGNISFILTIHFFLFINHVLELCIQKNGYWDLIKQWYLIPLFVYIFY